MQGLSSKEVGRGGGTKVPRGSGVGVGRMAKVSCLAGGRGSTFDLLFL